MDAAKRAQIASRLEKIAAAHDGRLTPDDVLKDAQNPRSPLHDQFEWDDSAAAVQWRLSQARELIRSIRVEVQTETKIVSTVMYVRDPSAGSEQGYVATTKLRTNRDLAREALLAELSAVRSRFIRAQSLALVLGLQSEFALLEQRVAKLQQQIDIDD